MTNIGGPRGVVWCGPTTLRSMEHWLVQFRPLPAVGGLVYRSKQWKVNSFAPSFRSGPNDTVAGHGGTPPGGRTTGSDVKHGRGSVRQRNTTKTIKQRVDRRRLNRLNAD